MTSIGIQRTYSGSLSPHGKVCVFLSFISYDHPFISSFSKLVVPTKNRLKSFPTAQSFHYPPRLLHKEIHQDLAQTKLILLSFNTL
jgi:hypothetical protein